MTKIEKTALSDEQMDKVIGGTMVPRTCENGDTLGTFADRIKATNNWNVTVEQLITWNPGKVPADANRDTPLPAGTVLKVYF